MRYTRKNISELMGSVQGGPDVSGFSTSNFNGQFYTLVSSFGGGTAWQSSTGNTIVCEDGAYPTAEDVSSACR